MAGLTPGREYTISVQSHHEVETDKHPIFSTTQKYCKIPLRGMTCSNFFFAGGGGEGLGMNI